MPSVRGRSTRATLATTVVFVVAGTATGALAGWVLALPALALGLSPTDDRWVLAAVVAGLTLDGVRLLLGRPNPPASGRQVPQEWSRFFSPTTVAVLYGARLGVGPLTILSTWTWWSFTVGAALIDPWTGAAVGATFGLVRLTTTIAASLVAAGNDDPAHHASRFLALRSRQRMSWVALTALGVAALGATVWSDPGEEPAETGTETAAPPASTTASTPSQRVLDLNARQPRATFDPTAAATTADATDATVERGEPADTDQTPPTIPVRLEDVVRADGIAQALAPTAVADPAQGPAPSNEPAALSAAIPTVLDGFHPVPAPEADRFLDLQAAAGIQPDPTEEVALLETRGFAGGWTRAFRNGANDVAVVSVYQFRDATEAEFYLEDGLITIGGYGGKFFDIPALPGVRGFVQTLTDVNVGESEQLTSLGAAFHLGPRWYLVYVIGSSETVTPDLLIPAVDAVRASAAAG